MVFEMLSLQTVLNASWEKGKFVQGVCFIQSGCIFDHTDVQ